MTKKSMIVKQVQSGEFMGKIAINYVVTETKNTIEYKIGQTLTEKDLSQATRIYKIDYTVKGA
jgi:hypothetical protein